MESGARQYAGRGKTGSGRVTNYADSGEQYGLALKVYRAWKAKRCLFPTGGRANFHQLYPLGEKISLQKEMDLIEKGLCQHFGPAAVIRRPGSLPFYGMYFLDEESMFRP